MLPADVDLVAYVDVPGVAQHPLWSKLEEDPFLKAAEGPLNQFRAITGLDPRRDVHMLVMVARGFGRQELEIAVIARGALDRERIEDLLSGSGFRPERRGKLEVYLPPAEVGLPAGVPGLPDASVAFLDDFTLAVGPSGILQGTVAVRNGDAPPLVQSPDLGSMIEEGIGSGQFWGVFRSGYLGDLLRQRIEEGIPFLGVLKGFSGVQGLRFSVRLSDSIDLVARARTGTEAEAQLLADTLNGFLALGKLVAKDQPDILRFLDGALVGLDVDSVRFSMNLDAANLDRIRSGVFQTIGRTTGEL